MGNRPVKVCKKLALSVCEDMRLPQRSMALLPMMERTSSSGEVGVPEMSGLLLLRLRERLRLRLAGRTAERAMVA